MLIGLVSGTLALSSISSSSIWPVLPAHTDSRGIALPNDLSLQPVSLNTYTMFPRLKVPSELRQYSMAKCKQQKHWMVRGNITNVTQGNQTRGVKTKLRKVPGTKSGPSRVRPSRTMQWKYRISNECKAALSARLTWNTFLHFLLVTLWPHFYHMCLFFKT